MDGFSQPGAHPNSKPFGQAINAVYRIVLDGSAISSYPEGVKLRTSANLVRGLVIQGFYDAITMADETCLGFNVLVDAPAARRDDSDIAQPMLAGQRYKSVRGGHVMPEVQIMRGYIPGSIGRVAELHATYYHRQWGFGLFFETKVASELAAFLGRYDEQTDGFWTVAVGGCIEGSIAIDGAHAAAEGAHLRWFIVSDVLRGEGVGGRLMETAISFCRSRGYGSVYLWTFEGLHAARHLYEKNGFRLMERQQGTQWGRAVNEQRFELLLG